MTFSPSRLTLARQRARLTRIALAEKAGIPLRTLTRYENGETPPSKENIAALASALSFPESFFLGLDLDQLSCEGASFRSLKSMTASKRDSALASGRLCIELSRWIEERFELPRPALPSLRSFDPEAGAEALRAKWGLGEKPINNMIDLLEVYGVRVFSLPLDTANIDAFSIWYEDKPFVFLNPKKTPERTRMDCAHELAHLTLHRHGAPRGREAEIEADRFAGAFLMPAGDILACMPPAISLSTILRMKSRWKVAALALVHRLRKLEKISEWQYRMLCKQLSQLGYRRSERDGITRESSQVLTKVFAALRSEGVSRASIARDLSITPMQLESLVIGLVLAALSGGRVGPPDTSKRTPNLKLA
jgi:Zn-dependent peptidase ImmA (M78 family)/DNA-binding XRE family transcriptional regulator